MIYNYILWFFLYSLYGWIYETALCSVREHKYINRGFLNGPYCPIYGCGAVLVIILLSRIENIIILFLASAVVTCSLEYFTGWMLERMFHTKWWNYNNNRFNIHGRICLLGAVAFGSFSVILLRIVHPVVIQVTNTIPQHRIIMLAIFIVGIIDFDIVYTLICLKKFNSKIKKVYHTIGNLVPLPNNTSINTLLNEHYSQYKEKMSLLIKYFNGQELRMIKAFPKMKSTLYNGTIHKIYEWLNQQHK